MLIMIDCKELRIGNAVLAGDGVIIIESIDEQGVNSSVSGGYYPGETEIEYAAYFEDWSSWGNAKKVNPIKVTEELLLKIGFKKHDMAKVENIDLIMSFNDSYIFRMSGKFYVCSWWHSGTSYGIPIPTNHLHQLQNVYYFLHQTELPINNL